MKCLLIPAGVRSFQEAARELVRPSEVPPAWAGAGASADALGAALREARASGVLTFAPDPQGSLDRWCTPSATLARGSGDCDDFAILACSALRAAGGRAWIVAGWRGRESHAWVEGHDARGAYLLEATSGQVWRLEGARPHPYRAVALLEE